MKKYFLGFNTNGSSLIGNQSKFSKKKKNETRIKILKRKGELRLRKCPCLESTYVQFLDELRQIQGN